MGTIAENLNTLYDIKDGIKAAIEGKGVDVGEAPFVEYAQKINDIQQNVDCEEAYNSGYNQGNVDGQTEGYKMGYRVGNAEGFTAGKTLGQDMQKAKLTTLTVTENGIYESEDGYSKITVDVADDNGSYDEGYDKGREDGVLAGYGSGYDKGVNYGVEVGMERQKEKLVSITITENGTYTKEDGYNEVTVNVVNGNKTQCRIKLNDDIDIQNLTFFDTDLILDLENVENIDDSFSHRIFSNNILRNTTLTVQNSKNIANMRNSFTSNQELKEILYIDTSNVTIMEETFSNCKSLTTIPQIDTSKVYNMYGLFRNCESLTTIPQIDTSNVIYMSNMFEGCSSLTTIPQLDTSNATNALQLFKRCSSLTTIPQLDLSNVTSTEEMFYGCNALTSIPQLDLSNVTTTNDMFYGCNALTTVGGFVGLRVKLNLYYVKTLSLESVYNIANTVAVVTDEPYIYFSSAIQDVLTEDVISIFTSKGWKISIINY